jgi:hypothetical protein
MNFPAKVVKMYREYEAARRLAYVNHAIDPYAAETREAFRHTTRRYAIFSRTCYKEGFLHCYEVARQLTAMQPEVALAE